MAWRYDFDYYEPSVPRKVKGGIKARTQRGAFGSSWWARRWIEVLEGFNVGARLLRGRRYARSGQVLSIDIQKGIIHATVQGSRPAPYSVAIKVKQLRLRDWQVLAQEICRNALFTAKLLRGEMPENIEEAFTLLRLSLFPKRRGDLHTSCSCPDWSNPCKHIAAAYYLLGEEFDRDPFLIFRLRGVERDEFITFLGSVEGRSSRDDSLWSRKDRPAGKGAAPTPSVPGRSTEPPRKRMKGRSTRKDEAPSGPADVPRVMGNGGTDPEGMVTRHEDSSGPETAEPLSSDPVTYWQLTATPQVELKESKTPPITAALPKQLGNLPFWRGEQELTVFLYPIYEAASASALDILAGESPGLETHTGKTQKA